MSFSSVSQDLFYSNLRSNILKRYQKVRKIVLKTSLLELSLGFVNSDIIKNNNNILYCAKFAGIEGLFNKEKEDTRIFGRYVCDFVKDKFNCYGFFTSDELPRYGINRKDTKFIFGKMNKKEGDGDLLVFFAYQYDFSQKILDFLLKYLNELFFYNSHISIYSTDKSNVP